MFEFGAFISESRNLELLTLKDWLSFLLNSLLFVHRPQEDSTDDEEGEHR